MKSKNKACDKEIKILAFIAITIDSIRLDRHCSYLSYMNKLGETKVFVIPKKNATPNG